MRGWCGLETPPQSDFGLLLVIMVTLKLHVALKKNSQRGRGWKWVGNAALVPRFTCKVTPHQT